MDSSLLPSFLGPVFMLIVLLGGVLLFVTLLKQLLIIVPPNRIAVITGRRRTMPDGQTLGYRVVRGGRTIRIPLLEQIAWMDLSTIPLQITVNNAIARGGIPIDVQAVANVKVASMPETTFANAVERLLANPSQIKNLAQETLAANLRGVLSTLTPEEANEDRVKFEHALMGEVTRDLAKLGLQLDMLKIQNISDEAGYLRAYGRIRTSEVLRDAKSAEAKTQAETEMNEAEARQKAAISKAQSDMAIAAAQNELRIKQATLTQEAEIAERRASAAADEAEAQANRLVQQARVEVTKIRLQVEEIEPALAAAEVATARARAAAANIVAEGEAQASAIRKVREAIAEAGEEGIRLLMIQQLPEMVRTMAAAAKDTKVDRLVVIGGAGHGGDSAAGMGAAVDQRFQGMARVFEQACAMYSLDPEQVLQGFAAKLGTPTPRTERSEEKKS